MYVRYNEYHEEPPLAVTCVQHDRFFADIIDVLRVSRMTHLWQRDGGEEPSWRHRGQRLRASIGEYQVMAEQCPPSVWPPQGFRSRSTRAAQAWSVRGHAANSEDRFMPVNWEELLLAYESVNAGGTYGGHCAWLSRATGEIIWNTGDDVDEEDALDESSDDFDDPDEPSDDEPSDHHESAGHKTSDEDIEGLPEDIDDPDKYLPVPNQRDLDLGPDLARRFAGEFLPKDFGEVQRIFRAHGAYSKFKALLARRKALDRWYDFEQKATEKALREWCEINSIEIEEQRPKP
jgi:hypothetical protein